MATRIDVTELRGWGRLAFDATLGVTAIVEGMHHNIARGPRLLDAPVAARTRGITGLVYGSVRGVTRVVAMCCDAALARLGTGAERVPTQRREAVVAALNGVVGDHLVATGNPLAIPMTLRRDAHPVTVDRAALADAFPLASSKVLVLVHGLCTSDLSWTRRGHDHGSALARDLGYTPVYLHYNTGLHVSDNGRTFAAALEALAAEWPLPVEELTIVTHSMGGLVARSACHQAALAEHRWLGHLKNVVFLGTPHHGAPLERGGNWVDVVLGITPYTAPLSRLGKIRSAGITDLRHGNVLDEDWHGRDRFVRGRDTRRPVPLPAGVRCMAIAATRSRTASVAGDLMGDGLVPLASALGRHRDPSRALTFEDDCRFVFRGMSHLDLLSDRTVYERLRDWLQG